MLRLPARAAAGPGSGKSHTIVGRVLHGPCSPEKTLVITYTTAAARVLKQRIAKAGARVFFAIAVVAHVLAYIFTPWMK